MVLMTKTIEDLFIYSRVTSNFALLALFIVFFRTIKNSKDLLALIGYCLLDTTIYFLSEHILTDHSPSSTKILGVIYSLYTLIEYSVFALFLWLNIHNKAFRRAILITSLIFLTFLLIYNLNTRVRRVDSLPIGVETIFILVYSFYYLYEQMNDTTNLFIYNKYQFWVITGFMLYLAGSFFIYIFANQADKSLIDDYWFLTHAFYILMNIFIGISFFLRSKKPNDFPTPPEPHPYLN